MFAIAFAVLFATTPLAEPAKVVVEFYAAHRADTHSGLLNLEELQARRRFLSRRLYERYAAAIRRQEDWIRRHPDRPSPDGGPPVIHKPPCVEGGDWFDSLFEWPGNVESTTDDPVLKIEPVRTDSRRPNTWHVAVRFSFDTKPVVEWIDTVVVVREDERFVIDDVIYSGKALFYRSGRLSRMLESCATD